MNDQFTPGPWNITESVFTNSDSIESHIGTPAITCAVVYAEKLGMNAKEQAANARLIASAPDLFYLLTAADRLETLTGENLAVYARTFAALARAAIARATGA